MKARSRYRLMCFLIILVWVVPVSRTQGQEVDGADINQAQLKDAFELLVDLIGSVMSVSPGSEYVPPLAREKMNWIFQHPVIGTTPRVQLSWRYLQPDQRARFAEAFYENSQPLIKVSLPALYYFVRELAGIQSGFNQEVKNSFLITLVHQAVHLEHTQAMFNKIIASKATWQIEEVRTWRKVTLELIRPLRVQNQSLPRILVQADDLLIQCADPWDCPAFEQFVSVR